MPAQKPITLQMINPDGDDDRKIEKVATTSRSAGPVGCTHPVLSLANTAVRPQHETPGSAYVGNGNEAGVGQDCIVRSAAYSPTSNELASSWHVHACTRIHGG